MYTAERVSSLIVIEFGIRPDRFPTGVRMTICARDGKRSVGIRHLGLGNAYTRLYARASGGITGRFAAQTIRGPAAWVAARIGLLCDSKGFAQHNSTSGWRQRNAAEHERQPERNGRETASKVHRSLRADGLHVNPRGAQTGKHRNTRQPASTCTKAVDRRFYERTMSRIAGVRTRISEFWFVRTFIRSQ
jgi:hypothetical protein